MKAQNRYVLGWFLAFVLSLSIIVTGGIMESCGVNEGIYEYEEIEWETVHTDDHFDWKEPVIYQRTDEYICPINEVITAAGAAGSIVTGIGLCDSVSKLSRRHKNYFAMLTVFTIVLTLAAAITLFAGASIAAPATLGSVAGVCLCVSVALTSPYIKTKLPDNQSPPTQKAPAKKYTCTYNDVGVQKLKIPEEEKGTNEESAPGASEPVNFNKVTDASSENKVMELDGKKEQPRRTFTRDPNRYFWQNRRPRRPEHYLSRKIFGPKANQVRKELAKQQEQEKAERDAEREEYFRLVKDEKKEKEKRSKKGEKSGKETTGERKEKGS